MRETSSSVIRSLAKVKRSVVSIDPGAFLLGYGNTCIITDDLHANHVIACLDTPYLDAVNDLGLGSESIKWSKDDLLAIHPCIGGASSIDRLHLRRQARYYDHVCCCPGTLVDHAAFVSGITSLLDWVCLVRDREQ